MKALLAALAITIIIVFAADVLVRYIINPACLIERKAQ